MNFVNVFWDFCIDCWFKFFEVCKKMHQLFVYMKEGSGLENIFKEFNVWIPNKNLLMKQWKSSIMWNTIRKLRNN